MSDKPAAEEGDKPKAKSKKMLIIIVGAVLVLALGGGGAFFYISKQRAAAEEGEDGAPAKTAAKDAHKAPPAYLPLDNMVVNLADPGGERVAQVGITLELLDAKSADTVKAYLPTIRSGVLMLISQRTAEELLKPEGKEKLAKDILRESSLPFGGGDEDHEDESAAPKNGKKEEGCAPGVPRGRCAVFQLYCSVSCCENFPMSESFLSQEEVDALLEGVTGESQKTVEEVAEHGEVRSYNISSQERIVRGRMPTMEIVNERFARNLRVGLFNFIRRSPEISVGPVSVQRYSAFLRELAVPTNFNIVAIRPLRGSGLIVCEPALVFGVIDTLYGGIGKFQTRIEGRDFSATEQRVINRMVDVITDGIQEGLEGYLSAGAGIPAFGDAAAVCQYCHAERNRHFHVLSAGNRGHYRCDPFLLPLFHAGADSRCARTRPRRATRLKWTGAG